MHHFPQEADLKSEKISTLRNQNTDQIHIPTANPSGVSNLSTKL